MIGGPETCRAMQLAISIIDLELASLAVYPDEGVHRGSGPNFEMYRARRVQVRAARDALARATPSSLRGAICMLLGVFHDAGCAPASPQAAVRRGDVLSRLEELTEFASALRGEQQQRHWFEVCYVLIELLYGGELELAPTVRSQLYIWRRPWYPFSVYMKVAEFEPAWRSFEASLTKGAVSLLTYRERIGPWQLALPDPQSPEPASPLRPGLKGAVGQGADSGIVQDGSEQFPTLFT